MNFKHYLPLLLLVVTLHYVFVAAMASKITMFTQSLLVVTTLCGALVVFVLSGFGEGER